MISPYVVLVYFSCLLVFHYWYEPQRQDMSGMNEEERFKNVEWLNK